MGVTLSKKGRVAIKQQGAWGTAETSFATTDYLEVEAPMVPTLSREALRTDTFRPHFTEPPTVAGSKAPTELTFRFPLHGWSAATPSADPTVFPDALLFECLLGNAGGDGYSTANLGGGSPANTQTTYTNAAADTAWHGYAVSYPTATARAIGWVKTVDTGASPDTATMIEAVQADIDTGTAYGSWVAWLSMDAQLPLTLDWLGSDTAAHIRYHDGLPTSVRLTLAAKQLPMVEVTMRFLSWENLGGSGAPADYAYGYPLIPATIGANGSYAALNGTAFCFATATIEMTQELVEVECHSSDQGASSMVPTDKRVTCEVVFVDTDLSTLGLDSADEPGESATGALQIDAASLTPGRSLSLLIPAPKLLEQPTLQDLGGKIATRVLYGCEVYTGDSGSYVAPSDTPFRIAWL